MTKTVGAENPLGKSGVAKMMCEAVISRLAQSKTAALGMVIHDRYPPSETSYLSMPNLSWLQTTNSLRKYVQRIFIASPIFSLSCNFLYFYLFIFFIVSSVVIANVLPRAEQQFW